MRAGMTTFDVATLSAMNLIPKRTLDAVIDPEIVVREGIDGLVLKVNARVAADSKERIYWMVSRPASWWQHFKQDVVLPLTRNPSTPLGRWLLDKSYPRLKKQEFEREVYTRVCPHIQTKDLSQHVEWLTRQP